MGVSLSTFEYIELCRLISWSNLLDVSLSLHVTYVCMMSGCEKYDRIRGTPSWQGTGGQYDCVVINGKTQMESVHTHTFLILHSVSNIWHLALVHQYC